MKIENHIFRDVFLIFSPSGRFETFLYSRAEALEYKRQGKKVFFISAGNKKSIMI
jgi:hypothetical protein